MRAGDRSRSEPLVRVGGHLSIAKGMAAMAKLAVDAGCEAAQVFTRSPRGGNPKRLEPKDVERMLQTFKRANIGPLVVHAPYYVSPANVREDLGELATRIIHDDRERAALLGASYVVVHAGHRKDAPPAEAVGAVVRRVSEAIQMGDGKAELAAVTVLLENGVGGQGDAAGDLTRWAACLEGIAGRGLPIGACLDTAHLWGAGILGPDTDVEKLLGQLEELGILGRLKLIHFNDSSVEPGSKRDRHEHIGEGQIPVRIFSELLRAERLRGLTGIAETDPSDDGVARDVAALKTLRGCG